MTKGTTTDPGVPPGLTADPGVGPGLTADPGVGPGLTAGPDGLQGKWCRWATDLVGHPGAAACGRAIPGGRR
ncbi:hypothetical protein [Nonomuraea sp. SBT364]|uniref:hypothetical protein n=1 Tax=Nonomuraea sp. SBT364 TaxID=1580530 RepID=UPI000A72682F|nr:hypothetical protein [Nonomuraea sp. SBT364]